LGFNARHDFETRIMVKPEAPNLLEVALAKPSWKPTTSGVTDSYQPLEKASQITRECLKVLANFRNPVGIITKNALVCRDIDILEEMAGHQASVVILSITTLDAKLSSIMEPRASSPASRAAGLAGGQVVGTAKHEARNRLLRIGHDGVADVQRIGAVLSLFAPSLAAAAGTVMVTLPAPVGVTVRV
jgi:hypothetical protein